MPRYWRDPADDTVHLSRPGCPIDEFDVIVIPVAQWRRMVELWEAVSSTVLDDAALDHAEELEAIIASVEVPHA